MEENKKRKEKKVIGMYSTLVYSNHLFFYSPLFFLYLSWFQTYHKI